jgi:hypothetical protein
MTVIETIENNNDYLFELKLQDYRKATFEIAF